MSLPPYAARVLLTPGGRHVLAPAGAACLGAERGSRRGQTCPQEASLPKRRLLLRKQRIPKCENPTENKVGVGMGEGSSPPTHISVRWGFYVPLPCVAKGLSCTLDGRVGRVQGLHFSAPPGSPAEYLTVLEGVSGSIQSRTQGAQVKGRYTCV